MQLNFKVQVFESNTVILIQSYSDVMCMNTTCLRSVSLHKVTSPTTGLACIIQWFKAFSWICVNRDRFDNIVVKVCTRKMLKNNFYIFSTALSGKHTLKCVFFFFLRFFFFCGFAFYLKGQ